MSAFYFLPRESTRRRETVLNIVLFHVAVGALACCALVFYPSILTAIFHDARLAPYSDWIGVTILFWITGAFLDMVPVANDEIRLASAFIIGIQASRALIFVGAVLFFGTLALAARGGCSARFDPDRRAGLLPGIALSRDFGARLTGDAARSVVLRHSARRRRASDDRTDRFAQLFRVESFWAGRFAVYSVGTLQLPLMGLI